jgi:hypothetical protein
MKKGTTRYLGLDVHKATITVALAEDGSQPVVYGTIANDPSSVRKLVGQLGREAKLVVAYEAGPTGYALHRQLLELGAECTVVAPALTPRRVGCFIRSIFTGLDLARKVDGPSTALDWRMVEAG